MISSQHWLNAQTTQKPLLCGSNSIVSISKLEWHLKSALPEHSTRSVFVVETINIDLKLPESAQPHTIEVSSIINGPSVQYFIFDHWKGVVRRALRWKLGSSIIVYFWLFLPIFLLVCPRKNFFEIHFWLPWRQVFVFQNRSFFKVSLLECETS